jgi:hypothetical protein
MFVPLGALSFALSLFVKDVGLSDDQTDEEEQRSGDDAEDATSDESTEHKTKDQAPKTMESGNVVEKTR